MRIGETSVKHCIQDVCLEILGEAAATKVAKVPLSNNTTAQRVVDLSDKMKIVLINQIKLAKYYSLHFNESMSMNVWYF